MANELIGEIKISIENKEYILKPSFQALMEIENQAGLDLFGIANEISNQKVRVKYITAIIYGGMLGGFDGDRSKMPFKFEELGQKLFESGFTNYIMSSTQFLAGGLKGKEKKSQ